MTGAWVLARARGAGANKAELLALLAEPPHGPAAATPVPALAVAAEAGAVEAGAVEAGAAAVAGWQGERPPEPPPSLLRPPAGPPTDEIVERLAVALAARPAHTMTDTVQAMIYLRGDARRRLLLVDDDLAAGAYRHRLAPP